MQFISEKPNWSVFLFKTLDQHYITKFKFKKSCFNIYLFLIYKEKL